jgi:hypothetical protein
MRRREFIAGLGAAAVWPVAARAQQTTTMPVIGYLDSNAAASKAPPLEALRAGLADAGYVEGKNLAIEYRWAAFDSRRLPELAADLVQRQVAAIVTYGARAPILAAKAATSTIPIIFIYAGDPVTDGLITSLSRPGGNLTGVTSFSRDVAGKRLDLLLKTVPQATTIGFLSGTPAFISYEQQTSQMFTAAGALGLKLTVVECRSERDFETAFAALVERAGRQPHHASWRERFAAAPPAPENPTPVETMAWRLRTPQGKKRYGLRKQTPEPVFGIIKAVMGFRQFLLRGFDCVVMAWNIKRMYALRLGPPAPRFNHVAVPEHRPPPPTLNRVR